MDVHGVFCMVFDSLVLFDNIIRGTGNYILILSIVIAFCKYSSNDTFAYTYILYRYNKKKMGYVDVLDKGTENIVLKCFRIVNLSVIYIKFILEYIIPIQNISTIIL